MIKKSKIKKIKGREILKLYTEKELEQDNYEEAIKTYWGGV